MKAGTELPLWEPDGIAAGAPGGVSLGVAFLQRNLHWAREPQGHVLECDKTTLSMRWGLRDGIVAIPSTQHRAASG